MVTVLPELHPASIHRRKHGFTLVEVALALGVLAFSLVGLIALIPAGLTNFRASMNASVGSQIFQRVVSDAEQADFDSLTKCDPNYQAGSSAFSELPLRYFDDEGDEVVPSSGSALSPQEALKVVYQVHVRVAASGPADASTDGSGLFTSLPASPGKVRFNPRSSVFLTIQIASNPTSASMAKDPATLLWSSTAFPITTYSAVVTRNGYNSQSSSGS